MVNNKKISGILCEVEFTPDKKNYLVVGIGINLNLNSEDFLNEQKKYKINPYQIFIDTSTTSSIPLTPSKKESKSIILTRKDGKNTIAKEIPISQIPLVYSMSKVMNILRVYTPASYRRKIEIATKSIQRELK